MDDLLYNLKKALGNALFPIKDYGKGNTRSKLGDYLAENNYQQPVPTSTPMPTRKITPSPTPTSMPTPTPVSPTQIYGGGVYQMPTPTVSSPGLSSEYVHKIPYKTDQGTTEYVPSDIAQVLMTVFDPIGAATESAQVLSHPRSQTLLDWEVPGSSTRSAGGENRGFKTGREVDIPNLNGSIDRGLFRINSDTFSGWMSNPESKKRLAEYGITSYDDMLDPYKNAWFARLLMESTPTTNEGDRSWRKWWAAPLELRHPSLKKK